MSTTKSASFEMPDLEAYWMPFTSNRRFKKNPKLIVQAEGMYCTAHDGRRLLDGFAGLWCCNAGHRHPRIVSAVKEQLDTLDYALAFQGGHPKVFELVNKVTRIAPEGMGHVFFGNSGSEAVETALKIALAYHRHRGEGTRTRFIGRERGYHGVGFGGTAVGGISVNRKMFGAMIPGVDHLNHTHDLERNAFSRGLPASGAHLADELERIVQLHDASNVAAVIVEPVAGSTGVLLPPAGYLQRLREICDRHGILLILDEVITGFGRVGAPFAAERLEVRADLITMAKGLTSGMVPMGGVLVRDEIYEAFMQGPEAAVEFAHGFTYSGHPLAAAAGCAALDVYAEEGLFERVLEIEAYWEDAVHSLRGLPHVIDIRNYGLLGAIELAPLPGKPGLRAMNVFDRCYEEGLLVRAAGDTIALSPSLIIEPEHIDTMAEILRGVLAAA